MLHVFQGECDWVIAESEDDAWAVWCETTGERRGDYQDHAFHQLPDDQPLRIWHEDNDPTACGCADLRKRDMLEQMQPVKDWEKLRALVVSQGAMVFSVPQPAPANTGRRFDPNGHERGCPKGFELKPCAEWATQGRGFLCTTEH